MNKPLAQPEAGKGIITDHPFKPRDAEQPWGLCGYVYPIGDAEPPRPCNLAESAHQATTVTYTATMGKLKYRCPRCVTRGTKRCRHK